MNRSVRLRLRYVGVSYLLWSRLPRLLGLAAERAEDAALRLLCRTLGHYYIPGWVTGAVVPGVGLIARHVEPPSCAFCLAPQSVVTGSGTDTGPGGAGAAG